MIKFFKKNWLMITILFLSTFFRLYKISAYMTFLGDEGRDALVWLRMIRSGKFTLIGPQTSIGNMYLGPLYYYLMLPFYFVLGTVGPSIGVALFGVATAFLIWHCGKEWFSEKVGILSAFFYSVSPVAIVFSKSSWNPNVMPFFALLTLWGIWQFWQKDKFWWLPAIGVTLSFAIQSHYLGLLLIPVVGTFFLIKLVELKKSKNKKLNKFISNFVLCAMCFVLLTVLPLIWFDLRHNFLNYKSFYKFFAERQTTVNFKFYKAIPNLWPLWKMVVTRLLAGKNETFGFWLAVIFGLSAGVFVFHPPSRKTSSVSSRMNAKNFPLRRDFAPDEAWGEDTPGVSPWELHKKEIFFKRKALILILVWLGIGLLGMGLYKQHIYDHYFGFLFPAVFLIAGWVALQPENFHHLWKYLSWVLILLIIVLSLAENPLRYPPGFQMAKVQEIDKKIISEVGDKPYNFALIAKQNYEAGYEYFLELWEKPSTQIDPQKFDQTVADQLFVVCEDSVCEPTTNSKAGIANFGWSKIEKEWNFPWGVKLFKLVHTQK